MSKTVIWPPLLLSRAARWMDLSGWLMLVMGGGASVRAAFLFGLRGWGYLPFRRSLRLTWDSSDTGGTLGPSRRDRSRSGEGSVPELAARPPRRATPGLFALASASSPSAVLFENTRQVAAGAQCLVISSSKTALNSVVRAESPPINFPVSGHFGVLGANTPRPPSKTRSCLRYAEHTWVKSAR